MRGARNGVSSITLLFPMPTPKRKRNESCHRLPPTPCQQTRDIFFIDRDNNAKTSLALQSQKPLYSSSSRFIARLLALNASANPPARLGFPCGVLAPLRSGVPVPPLAYPESLGVVAPGEGFAPRTGRLAGGAGGVGFALPATPLVFAAAGAGGGGGREAAAGGGGGGGAALTSSR